MSVAGDKGDAVPECGRDEDAIGRVTNNIVGKHAGREGDVSRQRGYVDRATRYAVFNPQLRRPIEFQTFPADE